MSRTRGRFCTIALIALSSIFLYGCMAGSYSSSSRNGHEKVYRQEEDGSKTLVYEVDKDGTLTVHDENDPRAQQMQEAEHRAEMSRAADAERLERIKAAPKREAGAPIYVALHETELDAKLKESQHSEGAVFDEIMKNFQEDDVIRLVDGGQTQASEWTQMARALKGESTKAAPAADVEVYTRGRLEEKAGINRQTGKLGTMWVVVFEATVSSNYLPSTHTVTEEGNVFRNQEVTQRLVEKIKQVIKNDIGPTLPADRSL
jgi:hypothetical protein